MRNILLTAIACALSAAGFGVEARARQIVQTAPADSAPPRDPWSAIPAGETVLRKADGTVDATYRYRLVEPPKAAIADPGARVPLVVFLHGSGERGSDNVAQLKHFAGWCASDALQAQHPCYVLAMQCPAGESWSPMDIKGARERGALPKFEQEPTRAMRAVIQAIEQVRQAKAVDESRIYLTGLSMGGFGAFDLAARRPDLFAAVVPICGGGDPSTAPTVSRVPVFIVHGNDDTVVPVTLSRAMRDAIANAAANAAESDRPRARGTTDAPQPMQKRAPNPMYREYEGVGHESWTPAYRLGDDGVLDWMFAQRRSERSGNTPQ